MSKYRSQKYNRLKEALKNVESGHKIHINFKNPLKEKKKTVIFNKK